MPGQLFRSDDFVEVEENIKQFDMTIFRNKARRFRAITYEESTQLAGMHDQLVHNEKLLNYILPINTPESFQKLTDTVEAMGPRYSDMHKKMLAILGEYKPPMVPPAAPPAPEPPAQAPPQVAPVEPTAPPVGNTPPSPEPISPIPESPLGDFWSAKFWKNDKRLVVHDGDYKMSSSPRGIALIINNKNFPDDVRDGTDKDRDALDKLWTDLHFKTDVMNNVDGEDMRIKLRNLATDPGHKSYDCVVVCILSHGDENNVCGSDNDTVPIGDLVELFYNDKVHRSLVGKPKMFFIQACRGGRKSKGVVGDAPGGGGGASGPARPQKTHASPADVLVCFSTAPGYLSWRDLVSGSWYVQCLVQIFGEHHANEHVLDLMTMVNDAMEKKFNGVNFQAPSFRVQLKKKVFLR